MPKSEVGAIVGSVLLLGSLSFLPKARADVAPPADYTDACANTGKSATRECVECLTPSAREPGCEKKAKAEGFRKECSGWGYTKYCRIPTCQATSAPAQRTDCVLVDLKWPRHVRATFPMHEEVCRSYRDESFAVDKLYARRLLCLKNDAPTADAGDDPTRACLGSLRADCDHKCQQGNAASCVALGDMYRQGQGVLPEDKRAAEYYERACLAKHAEACLTASQLYAKGSGSDPGIPERLLPDPDKAALLAAKACEAGLDRACKATPAAPQTATMPEASSPTAVAPGIVADAAPDVSTPPLDNRPPPVSPGGCGRCNVFSQDASGGAGLGWLACGLAAAVVRRRKARRNR
jgi:hypothetical protein